MSHYYPVTITAVRRELSAPPIGALPDQVRHLQWMCGEIDGLDPYSLSVALKAARWIGWILRAMEEMNIWSNETSRDLVRADALHGFDAPLQEWRAA